MNNLSSTTWTTRCRDTVQIDLDETGKDTIRHELMVTVTVDAPLHLDEVERLIADLQDAVTTARIRANP